MPLIRKPESLKAEPAVASDRAALRAQLASVTDDERWTAARTIAQFPDEVPHIAQALQSEATPRIREALFTALACIATPAAAEAAIEFLGCDDARVRNEALDCLVAMTSVVWPFLPTLLCDDRSEIRVLVCELVRGMPVDDAGELLGKLLESEESANVSAAAVDVLADLCPTQALPALERCAVRFQQIPYLSFAISIAIERIREKAALPCD